MPLDEVYQYQNIIYNDNNKIAQLEQDNRSLQIKINVMRR